MKATCQRNLSLIVTIFVMTLSLVNPGIVLADDGLPPVEPAVTEEPVAIDVPVSKDTPAPITDPASTEEIIEEESVQEILEQIPDEMAVIVLNEEGKSEPMATEAAAETILTSDPMWCPTGQTPGDAGCTAGYATAAELIAALDGVTGDGTIYFTSTYSTDDLWFDQTNVDLAGLSALTIQGGWNGSTGNAFALSGSTLFDGVGIEINNWNGAITLNNIIVDGAHGNGIVVGTDGDIHLHNVSSSNNDGSFTLFGATGAVLSNSNGSGDVILTGNNTFNNNDGGGGLTIVSTGNIILSNINANNNSSSGTTLINGGDVVLTGVSSFSGNGSYGLYIDSFGDVTLESITANENDNENMNVAGVYINNAAGTGNITITGTNEFNNIHEGFGHNYGIGLAAYSAGDITLSNISANNNRQFNILLDNTYGTGNIVLNGINVFTDSFIGARILSNGSITMENVTASDNLLAGLDLITSSGDIEINCGSIINNDNFGVMANTPSTATLNGVIFSGNLNPVILNGSGTLVENPFACGGSSTPKPGTAVTGKASNLSVNVISVASGQSVELDCEVYNGTRLSLSNGSSLFLPCPLDGSASLTENSKDDLPSILPGGQVFQSGFTTVLSETGTDLDELGTYATVSFSLPEGVDISTLSILYWNGDQWVEVDVYATDEGHLEAFVNHMGTFILVSK